MSGIEFARPELLGLLALLPVWALLVWPWARRGIVFARGESARRLVLGGRIRGWLVMLTPILLRLGTAAALIVALAGPQRTSTLRELETYGKGMGLVVDLSSSMLAEDMENGSSRIDVAKDAATRFAAERPYDELSLVGFAGEARIRVPSTTDPTLITEGVNSLAVQVVRDGTDISAALLASIDQLVRSDREERVVVLLTDGAHNGIGVPPLAAARAAAALGIRVHSISVLGQEALDAMNRSREAARRASVQAGPDMQTVLSGVAEITGGRYFHATTAVALDSIYEEINRLEAPRQRLVEYEETYPLRLWPLLVGLLLLTGDGLLRGTRWGKVP